MLTCLFWNFKCDCRNQESIVACMAIEKKVDILVLAETTVDADVLLSELRLSDPAYDRPDFQHYRFQIFTRFPGHLLEPFKDDDRVSIRKLKFPGKLEILLAAIHFYDRRNHDRSSQHTKAASVNQTIRQAEVVADHTRTIVFGDFNMNPFEAGMIDTEIGFGAMMTRDLASRHTELEVRGAQLFFNPMWSRLGRQTPEPPGTHYWDSVQDPFNIFWQSLDQVLVRPSLFGSFPDNRFHVLTSILFPDGETVELIRNTGKHWELRFSDHLPILFALDLLAEDADA